LSITASTVGTDAAMPPRPQQGLPAVAARRVQCTPTAAECRKLILMF
jgi:hypothetical protein